MKTNKEKIITGFRRKFHRRMVNIAKQINPSGYAIAEAYGHEDPDGPQIFGEMIEYLKSKLK